MVGVNNWLMRLGTAKWEELTDPVKAELMTWILNGHSVDDIEIAAGVHITYISFTCENCANKIGPPRPLETWHGTAIDNRKGT